ncbi:MAG: hypothetical protein JW800_07790 [Candidatus Omnitrophica bacterium]|nr:hypothetical protein [Candidatus Omnitrophota bacterium]
MKNKLLAYFTVLLFGLAISYYIINARFDSTTVGMLIFFLIFIPTLLRPEIGLVVIIISMLFSPEIIVGQTFRRAITLRIEDVFLFVIILAWFIRTAFTKDVADVFRTKLSVPFFLYIGICVASSVFAAVTKEELDIKNSFLSILKYLEYFLLFLMAKENIGSMRQAKVYLAVFFITAFLVGVHSNIFVSQQQQAGTEFFRAAAPMEGETSEPGTLGGYFIFLMAISSGVLIYSKSNAVRGFLILLLLTMYRGFLYSLSRGSYLAFVPMVLALVHFSKKSKVFLLWIVFTVSVLMMLFIPQMVRDRVIGTIEIVPEERGYRIVWEESPQSRISSWELVLFDILPRGPFMGHGVGSVFIDSQFFTTLTETGLIGFTLFVSVLIRLFKMVKEVSNMALVQRDDFSMGITVGFLAGYIGLLFHSIGSNTFIIIRIMEPFWFMAALVVALPQLLVREKIQQHEVITEKTGLSLQIKRM